MPFIAYQVNVDEKRVNDRPQSKPVFLDSGDAEDDDQQGPAHHAHPAVGPLLDVWKQKMSGLKPDVNPINGSQT